MRYQSVKQQFSEVFCCTELFLKTSEVYDLECDIVKAGMEAS